MNGSRSLLYSVLAAALLVSANSYSGNHTVVEPADVWISYPKAKIYFEFDSAALSHDSVRLIDEWVGRLTTDLLDNKLFIQGYTDALGTRDYNFGLGCRRARAAREAFIERGIAAERIRIASYGPDRPGAMGKSDAARALSRLVRFSASNLSWELPETYSYSCGEG